MYVRVYGVDWHPEKLLGTNRYNDVSGFNTFAGGYRTW